MFVCTCAHLLEDPVQRRDDEVDEPNLGLGHIGGGAVTHCADSLPILPLPVSLAPELTHHPIRPFSHQLFVIYRDCEDMCARVYGC